jgi:hypothetical protein
MSDKQFLKPKVFVGSSSEARDIVEGFRKALQNTATMVPWWQAQDFRPMQSTLEGLLEAVNKYDFGLFILTPDDRIESRGQEGYSARDNVFFELGLFLGKLGRERTFAVIQEGSNLKVLSDLAGITIPRFSTGDEDELMASISDSVYSIRSIIIRQGRRQQKFHLMQWWKYEDDLFIVSLSAAKLQEYREELQSKSLILVATKLDPYIHPEDDTRIARSAPQRAIGAFPMDLNLEAPCRDVFYDPTPRDIIQGHLLLIPEEVDVENTRTISEMIARGCDLLESFGAEPPRSYVFYPT